MRLRFLILAFLALCLLGAGGHSRADTSFKVSAAKRAMSAGHGAGLQVAQLMARKSTGSRVPAVPNPEDVIVIANSKNAPRFNLTLNQLYKAAAAQVVIRGNVVKNPYNTWREIDPSLPNVKIELFGPPRNSLLYNAFLRTAIDKGAEQFPELKALKEASKLKDVKAALANIKLPPECAQSPVTEESGKRAFACIAHRIRRDGMWIDAGPNPNAVLITMTQSPETVGIFTYGYFDKNRNELQAATIDGVEPTPETLAKGDYPLVR